MKESTLFSNFGNYYFQLLVIIILFNVRLSLSLSQGTQSTPISTVAYAVHSFNFPTDIISLYKIILTSGL